MNIKEIPFEYNTSVVSKKQFDNHLELYKGYVNKSNEIFSILQSDSGRDKANATYSKYRGLKKGETFSINGIILHEEYFKNMGSGKQPAGRKTLEIINKFFGSMENWKQDIKACATSARGWCITAYNQRSGCVSNFLQDAHDWGVITAAYPLIVLDMYEHAYFMDYGTQKNIYIEKFIDNINWEFVETKANNIYGLI